MVVEAFDLFLVIKSMGELNINDSWALTFLDSLLEFKGSWASLEV